eukprot:1390307-Amphidinium_carterae.1
MSSYEKRCPSVVKLQRSHRWLTDLTFSPLPHPRSHSTCAVAYRSKALPLQNNLWTSQDIQETPSLRT